MQNYRVLSFNLRINVAVDGIHAWDYRKFKIMEYIQSHDFDIIGLQEAGPGMYQELRAEIKDYEFFGTGRGMDNEAVPVLIKKDKFNVVESKTFWLSDTPTVESRVSGSLFSRVVTYVVLEDQEQRKISFFNTHLDYVTDEVCEKQAKILSHMIDEITDKHQCPFILVGDFNQNPNSKTVKCLTSKYNNIYEKKNRIGLTFHNFSNETEGLPIDYCFYSNHLKDESFEIVHHKDKNFFLSDHYPLIAEFSLKK